MCEGLDLLYVFPGCHFVLVFFSPFSISITSLGEERANLSAFRTFVRFVLVWICRFPLPLGIWEGLRFVIVAFPGLFSYPFLGSWFYNFFTYVHAEPRLKPLSTISARKAFATSPNKVDGFVVLALPVC